MHLCDDVWQPTFLCTELSIDAGRSVCFCEAIAAMCLPEWRPQARAILAEIGGGTFEAVATAARGLRLTPAQCEVPLPQCFRELRQQVILHEHCGHLEMSGCAKLHNLFENVCFDKMLFTGSQELGERDAALVAAGGSLFVVSARESDAASDSVRPSDLPAGSQPATGTTGHLPAQAAQAPPQDECMPQPPDDSLPLTEVTRM
jgi:hypothetical protein